LVDLVVLEWFWVFLAMVEGWLGGRRRAASSGLGPRT
jgi:hypothetical protein